ncbi:hypothetical protein [Nocardia carnea]|uniref:hypothetical protein n=1 Tax=Nocardia carnea TaxID=37328 RepID=UPI002458A0E3|nr:hypothetical protein [Nocardia carnea]
MYPIASADSAGQTVASRQCAEMPVRPVNAGQPRQAKTAGDLVIDQFLPRRR